MKYPLVLSTDIYGGRGGIALYNKHLIKALSYNKKIKKITAIPRKIFYKIENIPNKVVFKRKSSNSKLNFFFFFF